MSESKYNLPCIKVSADADFWIDQVGDDLEKQGVDSGNIFEFTGNLRPDDLFDGGVVISTKDPGKVPTIEDFKKGEITISDVFICRKPNGTNETIVRLGPGNPLFLSGWVRGVIEIIG